MDLFTLFKVILGRWRLVVPILAATVVVAFIVHTTAAPEYEASGFLLLETPELDVDDGRPTVNLVQVAQSLQDDGKVDAQFTVAPLGGSNFSVKVIGEGPQEAVASAEAIVEQLGASIAAAQERDDVPPAERVELRMITANVLAEPQPDGTFAASPSVFLHDPTAVSANPYLPNASTGRLLQVAVTGDAGQAAFAVLAGPGVTFVMDQTARDAAPLLQVVTTGSNPDQVIAAFHHVETLVARELEQRQERAGVLPSQRLRVEVLDAPLGVVDRSPPVNRATVGVLGLGGLLALGLAIGLEGLDQRRKAQSPLGVIDSGLAPAPMREPGPSASVAPNAVPWNVDSSLDSSPVSDEVPTAKPTAPPEPPPPEPPPPEPPPPAPELVPMPAAAGPTSIAGPKPEPAPEPQPAPAARREATGVEAAVPKRGNVSHSLEERLRLVRAEQLALRGGDQERVPVEADDQAGEPSSDESATADPRSNTNGAHRPPNAPRPWTRRLELADQGDRQA